VDDGHTISSQTLLMIAQGGRENKPLLETFNRTKTLAKSGSDAVHIKKKTAPPVNEGAARDK
jgi:hypothetical protein